MIEINETTREFEEAFVLIKIISKLIDHKEDFFNLPEQLLFIIFSELNLIKTQTEQSLYEILSSNSCIIRLYNTKRAAKEIIWGKSILIKNMFDEGLLNKEEFEQLLKSCQTKLEKIDRIKIKKTKIDNQEFLENNFLFKNLKKENLKSIISQGIEKEVVKGEFLFKENSVGDFIYVVLEGAVVQDYDKVNHSMHFAGSVIGISQFYDHNNKYMYSCKCESNAKFLAISNLVLNKSIAEIEDLEINLAVLFLYNYAHANREFRYILEIDNFFDVFGRCKIITLDKEKTLSFKQGIFLLKGEGYFDSSLVSDSQSICTMAPKLVFNNPKTISKSFKAYSKSRVLILDEIEALKSTAASVKKMNEFEMSALDERASGLPGFQRITLQNLSN